jgi:hypothetical protein
MLMWVFTHEVKDGACCGLGGRVIGRPDIYEQVVGEKGREAAEQVHAARRRHEAELLLAAAGRANRRVNVHPLLAHRRRGHHGRPLREAGRCHTGRPERRRQR